MLQVIQAAPCPVKEILLGVTGAGPETPADKSGLVPVAKWFATRVVLPEDTIDPYIDRKGFRMVVCEKKNAIGHFGADARNLHQVFPCRWILKVEWFR
jgi:hypothetical protein